LQTVADLRKEWTEYEKMYLLEKAFLNIDIDKLKSDYTGTNSIDDATDFDFTFEIDGKEKKVHIYLGRQDQILAFAKQINEMIVFSGFQIGYDEEYFKKFNTKD
jgi:hypothetical protein